MDLTELITSAKCSSKLELVHEAIAYDIYLNSLALVGQLNEANGKRSRECSFQIYNHDSYISRLVFRPYGAEYFIYFGFLVHTTDQLYHPINVEIYHNEML